MDRFIDAVLESSAINETRLGESGKVGWALLWLLGVPLPILIILYYLF